MPADNTVNGLCNGFVSVAWPYFLQKNTKTEVSDGLQQDMADDGERVHEGENE